MKSESTQEESEMLRKDWKFYYNALDVLGAAKTKVSNHNERLQFWLNKHEEIKAKIKSEGIDFDDSLADIVSNSYAGRGSISINDSLLKDHQECKQKIMEHRAKKHEYETWVKVLSTQQTGTLELHHDDWLFFWG